MNLLEYIISRGTTKNSFPSEPDIDNIVVWLERNNYDFVSSHEPGDSNSVLMDHKNNTGMNCYALSRKHNDIQWIRILCKDRIFFVRTEGKTAIFLDHIPKMIGKKMVGIGRSNSVTFEHMKSFLEENS